MSASTYADKHALFSEIARVLRPGGLLVMHDQTGPLPKAMAPATRSAPFIAPSLPQLIRYVEAAGLRLTTWQDSTAQIVAYFQQVKARLGPPDAQPDQGLTRGGSGSGPPPTPTSPPSTTSAAERAS